MVEFESELVIRSRSGFLRDLVPIYSIKQLIPNLVVLGLIGWATGFNWPENPFPVMVILLGWVFQFVTRPSVMPVSEEQAVWLEAVLVQQGIFTKSDLDGKWRDSGSAWWNRFPHQCIAICPDGEQVVVAPRDQMESLRAAIELMQEHGDLTLSEENAPFVFDPPVPAPALPWHMQIPSVALGAACVISFFALLFSNGADGFVGWGLSVAALREGRFENLFLHMFAHGGGMHLAMNMSVLASIGATLTSRLGSPPMNWLRFFLVFLLSALAGAIFYLALHPMGEVPMIGASGGLYGLYGLLIRVPADDGPILPIRSTKIRRASWDFVKVNAFLFGFLALIAWTEGNAGGLAWESHLGGFLFGLFIGPKFLPRARGTNSSRGPATDPASSPA